AVDRGNEEALVRRQIVEFGLDEPAAISRRDASPPAADLHIPGASTDPSDRVEPIGCRLGPIHSDQPNLVADFHGKGRAPAPALDEATVWRLQRGSIPFEPQPFLVLGGVDGSVATVLDRDVEIGVEHHAPVRVQKPPPVPPLEVPAAYRFEVVSGDVW